MNSLTKKLAALGASAVIATTGGLLVGPYEGVETTAYKDMVGVWTICYGETKGVKAGATRTLEQCEASLASELSLYHKEMMKGVKVDLPDHMQVAYTSFVWNVGIGAWNSSTLLKLLNQKEYEAACAQLLRWTKAGGVVVKGLQNRRQGEYKTCMGKDYDVNAVLAEFYKQDKEQAERNAAILLGKQLPEANKGFAVVPADREPTDSNLDDRYVSTGDSKRENGLVAYTCRFTLGSWCLWKVY